MVWWTQSLWEFPQSCSALIKVKFKSFRVAKDKWAIVYFKRGIKVQETYGIIPNFKIRCGHQIQKSLMYSNFSNVVAKLV